MVAQNGHYQAQLVLSNFEKQVKAIEFSLVFRFYVWFGSLKANEFHGRCTISRLWEIGWLCWGLTSQSTIFQSCRDGAIASWVINQYFRGVKCLAQGHNTAAVGLELCEGKCGFPIHSHSPNWKSVKLINKYGIWPRLMRPLILQNHSYEHGSFNGKFWRKS